MQDMQGAPQGVGPDQAMEAMKGIQDAMMNLLEGGKEAGMPPDALAKLEEASAAYGAFLDAVTGGGGAKAPMAPEAAAGGVPVR